MGMILRGFGWIVAVLCILIGASGLHTCLRSPVTDRISVILALCILGIGLALARWLLRLKRNKSRRAAAKLKASRAQILAETLFGQGSAAALEELKSQSGGADLRQATLDAVPDIMRKALEDGVISEDEERRINDFCTLAGLDNKDLPEPWRTRLVAAGLLRDLMSGRVNPSPLDVAVPFNLQKGETLIWFWPTVPAWELKTEHVWEAGTKGANIRIVKGVYWRVGATKGRRVPQDVRRSLGSGPLAVTDRHIYYQAGTTSLRLKFDNVVSIMPTEDGILVGRDGTRATPLEFGVADRWLALNIMANAKNWAE